MQPLLDGLVSLLLLLQAGLALPAPVTTTVGISERAESLHKRLLDGSGYSGGYNRLSTPESTWSFLRPLAQRFRGRSPFA
jgi:hypothetical protein